MLKGVFTGWRGSVFARPSSVYLFAVFLWKDWAARV